MRRQIRWFAWVLGAVIVWSAAGTALAQGRRGGPTVVPGRPGRTGGNTPAGPQAQGDPTDPVIVKYDGVEAGTAWGRQCMLLVVEPANGGQRVSLVVPNQNPMGPLNPSSDVVDVIKPLKPGALLQVSVQNFAGVQAVHSVSTYDLKPGEDKPNAFLFVATRDQKVGTETSMAVDLTRFGQKVTGLVPNKRGADGKMAPDPAMAASVKALAAGDVVDADIRPDGMLASIEKYIVPEQGQFVQAGVADVDGEKRADAEVKVGDATKTLLVPLKTGSNGKVFPDPTVLGQVKGLRAGQAVIFQARADGDKLILKDIQVDSTKPARRIVPGTQPAAQAP